MNICIFCHQNYGKEVPAKFVAPQCPTEPNGPWSYIPVCAMHADGWWDGSDYPTGHGAPAIITIPRHDPPFCVDGHEFDDEDSPFTGDGQYPPFVVFDVEAQDNLPGTYPTREAAQVEADRLNELLR